MSDVTGAPKIALSQRPKFSTSIGAKSSQSAMTTEVLPILWTESGAFSVLICSWLCCKKPLMSEVPLSPDRLIPQLL